MKNFKFPANIRQIGSIDQGLKIYVEDYVISYLKQYINSGGDDEQLSILMGTEMVIDEQRVLFISGAIEGRYAIEKDGILQFTDKTWEYMLIQKEGYFDNLEVVGFVQSQPSYGTYLNSNYANYHINNFPKPYQVMLVWDPIENSNSFYVYNDDQSDLVEATGYFIYYDKNKSMHEYMMQNRSPTPKIPTLKEDKTIKYLSKQRDQHEEPNYETEEIEEQTMRFANTYKTESLEPPDDNNNDDDIQQDLYPQKLLKPIQEQKRAINLLVALSGVLFVLAFVMGMGLMQNVDKVSSLENDIKTLSTSYRNLVATAKDTTVFASQSDEQIDNSEISTTDDTPLAKIIEENGNELLAENKLQNLLEPAKEEDLTEKIMSSALEAPPADTPQETAEVASNLDTETKNDIPEYYVVQKGDNLLQISMKFYGTKDMTKAIMQLNEMDDADKIFYGKKLKLPKQ